MGKAGSLGRLSRVAVLVGIAAALVGVPLAASANPDVSGFELDGNAASSGAADWSALGSPLDFTGFINDGTDDSDIGYGSGSNKDIDDVSTWSWSQDDVTPNKDDIVSAYASVYAEQNNLILYFGQTRLLDKQGDANVGFWFLQNPAGLNANGSFSGSHANGDILVQSEFTNGGSVSGVHIYEWQGGSLQLVSNQAQCVGGKLGTASACAIVNTGTISTSWAGDVTSPYFFEGGLNLSALFPQSVPCFSTFLTNTRTSQSESAELKDFAMGDIDTCGQITVKKTTVPAGGGPFSFTTTGAGLSGFDLSGGGEKTFTKLQPGAYSVSESALPSAWALDGISCTTSGAGTSTSTSGATANITLGFLGNAVCTYTNKRQPQLTLVKSVVNDSGGTAAPAAWTLSAAGSSGSFSGTANTAAVTAKTVTSGVQYTLAESGGPAGYSASGWVCNGGSFAGPDKITLGLGDDVTCTITNNDQPATLIVKKVVVNDNGGTKQAQNFSFQVNGGAAQSFEADGQNDLTVNAGTYSVTEPAVAGYTTSYSNCSNLVVPSGGSATCTVTNDDQAATLIVKKVVVNDNGGTKVASDFSFQVNGGAAQAFEADGQNDLTVNAGTYNVVEPAVAGYSTSYSSCSNLVIPNGGSATCTITNNDQPAALIVKKVVVNDNGGTKVAADFSFQVNGGSAQAFEADGQNDLSVGAGTYSVTEPAVAGYTTSYSNCSNLVIPNGGSATCTITNDDQAATLIVVKHVVNDNGGTAVSGDFQMTVDDAGSNPPSFPGADSPGTTVPVDPGAYSVSESGPGGYTMSQSAGCSGSIVLGQTKTCTVTNDDNAPKLTLVKQVVNDNGGTQTPSAWNLAAAGPTGFSGAGPSVSSGAGFDAGSYDLSETGPAGYDASAWVCSKGQVDGDTVSVALGDDVTCTVVNNDKAASLIVRKVVVNDNGGTARAQDFSFQVNGGAAHAFEADGQNDLTVNAGTYNVVEPAVAGYTTSYQGCSNIVLLLGGTATCTVTNNDVPRGQGSISVSKSANPTSIKEPGGQVTYSVTITNTSADVVVTVDNVVDDKFGDLDDDGGNGCFDVPINLVPGGKVNCTFSKTITGAGGTSHVNVVTVTAHDENGHPLTASDDARVDITPRLIDLVIVKDASSPTPLNGIVNYSLKVTNKGPDTATDVQLADPAPAGITYLTASPSQGTCNVSAALVTCSLGSIAPGQTVTIAVTGRATVVGTLTNTATVTGSGGRETNPADNVDSAVTVVPAPLRPPVVKPKPQPKPEVCLSLVVSPKMITADGKPDTVKATVSAGGKRMKGAKVGVSGAGVAKTARTNGKGVAVLRINPRKPGIITVTVVESHQSVCGPKRIGVVGVFLPPLTG